MTSLKIRLTQLPDLRPRELRALWRDVWRQPAPPIGPDLLRRGIAWKLQTRVHGDLPSHVRREVETIQARLRCGESAIPPMPTLRPGTRLVRQWNGAMHHVVVLADGFEHEGRQFQSLTQIARAITGTHQSGLRFFGVTKRKSGS